MKTLKYYQLLPPISGYSKEFFPFNQVNIYYSPPKLNCFVNILINTKLHLYSKILEIVIHLFKTLISLKKVNFFSEAFIVNDKYINNYFHWVNDILPKLYYLHISYPNSIVILSEEHKKIPFIQESIYIFKLQYYFISNKEKIYIKRLYKVEPLSGNGAQNPEFLIPAIDLLKQNLVSNISDNLKVKIYITRRKANNRRTFPEGELEEFLKKSSYLIIEAENLSFQQQVELFSKCSHLISVHGAGLTNMLYMPKTSNVLEIKEKGDTKNYCYYFMANACKHKYLYFFGTPKSTNKSVQENDLYIDIVEFQKSFNIFNKHN